MADQQQLAVFHDYFAIRGGGERLVLSLVRGHSANLTFGYRTEDSYGREDFPDDVHDLALPVFWRKRGRRPIALAHIFRRLRKKAAEQPVRVFSGVAAVFAAPDKSAEGCNIFYCHTPPRFLFDQRAHFAQSLPVHVRPFAVLMQWLFEKGYRRSIARMDVIRKHIPNTIRLIVQIIIVASLVIVIDQFLQAYFFDISQRLSVFVSLITTNCLVLGRTESFARSNPPLRSMVDALGNGLGYSLVLIIIGAVRELFGQGSLLGYDILRTVDAGGWYTPLSLMLLAPSAFFLLGGLVWAVRSFSPAQIEDDEFEPPDRPEVAG